MSLSSSPNRSWVAGSPSLLRYSHRSSTSSINSAGPLAANTPSSRPPSTSGWSNLALKKQSTGSTMIYPGGEETRSWTFIGFEWVVRDVAKLRDHVEGLIAVDTESEEGATNDSDFDVLKTSPVIGDSKFKLEISRITPMNEGTSASTKSPGLSLYITPLMFDFAHPQYEMAATMMVGVKCQDDRAGERGARADWAYEVWDDWIFRQDSEVWECALPSLSALLENPRINDTDSFVICVQIHSPVGPSLPAQPSVYYVPKDLLDGLEASLDNPNTGDVQFVCLERLAADPPPSPSLRSEILSPTRPSSSTSSVSPFATEMTARKRIIYAHSDILKHRSEYFATMLSSSFSENQVMMNGERKMFTVVVEEADFETIYWLLKYCYANWLLFKEIDDPRAAVEGVGRGWSAHWLHAHGGEWDWKTFPKHGPVDDHAATDTRSVTSGESFDGQPSPAGKGKAVSQNTHIRPPPSAPPAARVGTGMQKGASSSTTTGPRVSNNTTTATTSSTSRRVGGSTSMPLSISSSSPVRPKHVPIPLTSVPPSNFPVPSHYPVSPHTQRPRGSSRGSASPSDPHLHPTPHPPPASALAMYQVAHRYAMPGLSALALEHMMSTITPASSFALLLATSLWDELKTLVEDYVVDKWDEVSVSEEFEVCCQEVAAGEWGPEGGKTLTALFRRLRSPATMIYARP